MGQKHWDNNYDDSHMCSAPPLSAMVGDFENDIAAPSYGLEAPHAGAGHVKRKKPLSAHESDQLQRAREQKRAIEKCQTLCALVVRYFKLASVNS